MTRFNFAEIDTQPEAAPEVIETLPAPRNALDLDSAKKAFEPYRLKILDAQQYADHLEVQDDATEKEAIDAAARSKKLMNALETERKRVIEAPDKFVRSVNAFCRTFKEPLDGVASTLRQKIATYQFQKELERRKVEKAMQEEAARLQAKLEVEAKEAGVEPPPVMPVPAPRPDSMTRTESGASASIRTAWTGEVIDPDQVPREFCSPDEKKITAGVKSGIREIPGVRIYEKPITVLRS